MNVYTPEEIERINKVKETNDKLEEFFNGKREEWNNNVEPLFQALKITFTIENSSKIIDIQSSALSFRQIINEQISYFLNRRSREDVKLKKLKQDKFLYYAVGVGLKTSMGEKNILIDAHIGENERTVGLIENYIEHLRTTSKNLESLGFTIKNIIELFNYLSK